MRKLTVSLEEHDQERLATEAEGRGVSSGELAREFILGELARLPADAAERQRRWSEALAGMEKLRRELREAGYPSVDAVEVARRAREELEQRPFR